MRTLGDNEDVERLALTSYCTKNVCIAKNLQITDIHLNLTAKEACDFDRNVNRVCPSVKINLFARNAVQLRCYKKNLT